MGMTYAQIGSWNIEHLGTTDPNKRRRQSAFALGAQSISQSNRLLIGLSHSVLHLRLNGNCGGSSTGKPALSLSISPARQEMRAPRGPENATICRGKGNDVQ